MYGLATESNDLAGYATPLAAPSAGADLSTCHTPQREWRRTRMGTLLPLPEVLATVTGALHLHYTPDCEHCNSSTVNIG